MPETNKMLDNFWSTVIAPPSSIHSYLYQVQSRIGPFQKSSYAHKTNKLPDTAKIYSTLAIINQLINRFKGDERRRLKIFYSAVTVGLGAPTMSSSTCCDRIRVNKSALDWICTCTLQDSWKGPQWEQLAWYSRLVGLRLPCHCWPYPGLCLENKK